MLWVYGHLKFVTLLSAGTDFGRQNLTSRDVGQILTSKVDPRTERVNEKLMKKFQLAENGYIILG